MLLNELNLNNLPLETLEAIRHETDVFLFKQDHEGEDYTARYRQDANFDELLSRTVELKDQVYSFLLSQKRNIRQLVVIRSFVLAAEDDEYEYERYYLYPQAWIEQNKKLAAVLVDFLFPILLLGIGSMEQEKRYHSTVHDDNSNITENLREYSLNLAGNINETTKKMIVQQIRTSTALAESQEKLATRLKGILDNEKRAELIAQTESVRAYSRGRREIADELGLTRKTWEATWGACPICGELSNTTVNKDDQFPGGYDEPPAHPRCKCSIRYE